MMVLFLGKVLLVEMADVGLVRGGRGRTLDGLLDRLCR